MHDVLLRHSRVVLYLEQVLTIEMLKWIPQLVYLSSSHNTYLGVTQTPERRVSIVKQGKRSVELRRSFSPYLRILNLRSLTSATFPLSITRILS